MRAWISLSPTTRSTPLRISVPSTATRSPWTSNRGALTATLYYHYGRRGNMEQDQPITPLTSRGVTTPWTFAGESADLGSPGDRVTLVEASAFAISGPNGNMVPGSAEGFFFRDTRFLSGLRLRVNGQVPEALATATPDPFSATFVGRVRPQPGKAAPPPPVV